MKEESDRKHESNSLPIEVSVDFAAKYLGTTERTIINYLKARQLIGQKVGKKWFISRESLIVMRPIGRSLIEAQLPPIENPRSARQESRKAKEGDRKAWELVKSPKRNPMRLNAFSHLKDAYEIIERDREELAENNHEFFRVSLLEIGDDLGAGFYSFGPMKRKLYGRARIRAGRLVARAVLLCAPPGVFMVLCQLVEAIAFLCRSLERKSLLAFNEGTKQKERGRENVQT